MAVEVTSIMNFLDPQFLMGVLEERQDFGIERPKYIGERYFPRQNFPEQTILWETVRRENRLAGVYSARGRAISGDDIDFKTRFANLVWIKAAKYLDPDTVQKIRDPGMVAVYKAGGSSHVIQGIAERVAAKMREYSEFVDDQMAAQREYFAIKALLGELNWPPRDENGLPLTNYVDMNPEWNAEQEISVTWPFTPEFVQSMNTLEGVPLKPGFANRTGTQAYWNETGADPRHDLEVIADMMMELKGVDVDGATAIMSRKALSYIAELPKVQEWFTGTNKEQPGASSFAPIGRVKEAINTLTGLKVETYDAKWSYLAGKDANGNDAIRSVRFLPANKMIIVPRGEKVGVMAQAPHENQAGAYVYGDTMWVHRQEFSPYDRQLGMDNIVFPLLTDPEAIGVFTIFE